MYFIIITVSCICVTLVVLAETLIPDTFLSCLLKTGLFNNNKNYYNSLIRICGYHHGGGLFE